MAHNRMSQNINDAGRAFQEAAGIPFLQRLPEVATTLKALAAYAERRRRGIPFRGGYGFCGSSAAVEDVLAGHGMSGPKSAFAANAAEVGDKASGSVFPLP